MFLKDPFLAVYSSSMIFLLLCLPPSVALFMLTIWPFGPPPPRSPLRWRPHNKLCFDWSAGLSTGVFLSIRENVRPPSSQWIPTKLTSSPQPPLIQLPPPFQSYSNFSWDHTRPHSFLFLTCTFAEGQVFPTSQDLTLYLCFLIVIYYMFNASKN